MLAIALAGITSLQSHTYEMMYTTYTWMRHQLDAFMHIDEITRLAS
jgi:hypothetical protein